MNKSLFLDTNVIYNIIQNAPNSEKLLEIIETYTFNSISSLTQFFTYNFCVYKQANNPKEDFFQDLQELTVDCFKIESNQKIFENAKKILKDKDFEDALQVASALYHKCDAILTSDEAMANNYKNLIQIIFVPKK
jgi:predicted nucleic acid-binding protein